MELLEQCKNWNDDGEYEKVLEALEILPENARSPEMDSELARAYNNLGNPGEHKLFLQALNLLKPHEEYFKGNHKYYFRVAFAYAYLDEDGPALHYFKKALDARPGDEDTYEMMEICVDCLTNPRFEADFSVRVYEMWKDVGESIANLEKGEDYLDKAVELVAKGILKVFKRTSVNCFIGDEKINIELEASDDKADIFMLEYIKTGAPRTVKKECNIKVGLSAKDNLSDFIEINKKKYDISVLRFYVTDDRKILIYNKAATYISKDVIQKLFIELFGEIDLMANDFQIEVIRDADFEKGIRDGGRELPDKAVFLKGCIDFKRLRDACGNKGFRLGVSAEEYLKMYSGYQLQPEESEDIREDVYAGTTCLPSLISEYLAAGEFDKVPIMDEFHRNGVIAGFICFALNHEKSWDNTMEYEFQVMKLRDELINHITRDFHRGGRRRDIVFIEGATGTKYGYLDFLIFGGAGLLISSATDFFKGSAVKFAVFKTFRKISGAVILVSEG